MRLRMSVKDGDYEAFEWVLRGAVVRADAPRLLACAHSGRRRRWNRSSGLGRARDEQLVADLRI